MHITEIEKQIRVKLELFDINNDLKPPTGYAVGYTGEIIGLRLVGCKLTDISFLKDLTNLTYLDLRNNLLVDISTIAYFTNLTELALSYNRLIDISSLEGLMSLKYLDLRNNLIKDITSLVGLSNLKTLDVSNNRILYLPKKIVGWNLALKWEWDGSSASIFLAGNPFEQPPIEIVKKGTVAINAFLRSMDSENRAINEVRVLLVGDGGSGKTSLVNRILGKPFDPDETQTYGIDISPWTIDRSTQSIKVHLWDFGGQVIMHATHQFFFSKRSLYILVLDGRKEADIEYWLKLIQSFGGDSPILVVINKIDQNHSFDVDQKTLRDTYPQIRDFYRLSCNNYAGIDEFCRQLSSFIRDLQHINSNWPPAWFSVKQELELMKNRKDSDYISYDHYVEICKQQGITQDDSEILVEYLHDLGVVLYFKDSVLSETSVINPVWATQAVYQIINSQILAMNKGVLHKDDLLLILDKEHYPRHKHDFIIQLMQKFELCFLLSTDQVLIPDLASAQSPDFNFDYIRSFNFYVEYDFLPKSIIARFIVRMNKDIKDKLFWRTGVFLEDPLSKCQAVIKVDEGKKQFWVHVAGFNICDYFPFIRKTLSEINLGYEKMKTVEYVPCNCTQCSPLQEKHHFKYDYLKRVQEKGFKKVQCVESIEEVELVSLLTNMETNSADKNYPWKVFVSYCSMDHNLVAGIVRKLKEKGIRYWLDEEQIAVGDSIIEKIETGLTGSIYLMACYSRNQLKSGWSRMEIESALSVMFSENNKRKVLPIILDDLQRSELPVSIRNLNSIYYKDTTKFNVLLEQLQRGQYGATN